MSDFTQGVSIQTNVGTEYYCASQQKKRGGGEESLPCKKGAPEELFHGVEKRSVMWLSVSTPTIKEERCYGPQTAQND
jgi:hypothetical protein